MQIISEGYLIEENEVFITKLFIDFSEKREEIFENIDAKTKVNILLLCQEIATEIQLFDIWIQDFDVEPSVNIIAKMFLEKENFRTKIFQKITEKGHQKILQICNEIATEKQLFDMWLQGFNVKPSLDFISKIFIKTEHIRKEILEKLSEQEKLFVWNLFLKHLSEKINTILSEKKTNMDIALDLYLKSVWLCAPYENDISYKMVIKLLDSIKNSIKLVVSRFTSAATQKKYNSSIIDTLYKPILNSIFDDFIPKYRILLHLDGYYDSLNKNYVLKNFDTFDEVLAEKILAIRFEDLNTMIFAKKIANFESDKINDHATLINFVELVKKYDSQNYETLLSDLLPKITKENQFRLWLDNYNTDLFIENFWGFYDNADELLKTQILNKINSRVSNFRFLNNLKDIGIIEGKADYERFIELLLWYKQQLLTELETDNAKIVATRLLYLGEVTNPTIFGEIKYLLDKLQSNKNEYTYLINWLYSTNSDYCKLMLYIYDFVKPTNAEITKEFTRIFKEQHKRFLVTKAEKDRFETKARQQMPDFQTKWLRNIKPSTFLGTVKENEGNKVYHTSYENIYFENESFKIKLSETNGEEVFSKSKEWGFSKLYFNLLQDYFNHRQLSQYIRVTVNQKNEILTTNELIDDLRELQKNILVVWLRHKKELRDTSNRSFDKLDNDLKILSNKDIKRITNEENSECVGYLFDNQPDRFLPIYVLELSTNEYSISSVGSWLFSIPLKNNEVAIVWESVKLDRATHIFKCLEKDYETVLKNIENYLMGENTLKRSRLSSKDAENVALQEELFYETSLQHDWVSDCKNWYDDVKMVLEL